MNINEMIEVFDFADYRTVKEYGIKNVYTEFFVNKEKRTVVCKITTFNDIPFHLQKYGITDDAWDVRKNVYVKEYVGIAKCAPEDTWDESFGRKLAEYRASLKRWKDVNNELRKSVKRIDNKLLTLEQYGFMWKPHDPQEGMYE